MKSDISFSVSKEELIKALQESTIEGSGNIHLHFEGVKNFLSSYKYFEEISDTLENFEKLIRKYEINLKDMRDVIMLANSWYSIGPSCGDQEMIENYLSKKEEYRDGVYSWELISLVLNTLSTCKNPVSDFYLRIKRTNPEDYDTFVDFLKTAYKNEIDQ